MCWRNYFRKENPGINYLLHIALSKEKIDKINISIGVNCRHGLPTSTPHPWLFVGSCLPDASYNLLQEKITRESDQHLILDTNTKAALTYTLIPDPLHASLLS